MVGVGNDACEILRRSMQTLVEGLEPHKQRIGWSVSRVSLLLKGKTKVRPVHSARRLCGLHHSEAGSHNPGALGKRLVPGKIKGAGLGRVVMPILLSGP